MLTDPNAIAAIIVDAVYRISVKLGPGLTEKVYETVLARDLTRRGLHVERQKKFSFDFEGLWFDNALQVDLIVNGCVIVEIKSVKELNPSHFKQLLTYLRLLDLRLGLLINFGAPTMKAGIKRVVNRL